MRARLPADLLHRPAEEAARLLALGYLDEIEKASLRLGDPSDTEALHDFRVGLRRLRSCIRAYRSHFKGSVSKRTRRRLRDLTAVTNAARDTQVQLAWLHQQAGALAGEVEGLAWLVGRLEGRRFEALQEGTTDVAGQFSRAASKLRRRLRTFRVEVRPDGGSERRSFGQATSALVRSHVLALKEGLAAVEPDNEREAHATRIAAKRLRYLLEPLVRRAPRGKSLIGRLKELQDVLGDLHDVQILSQEITSSRELLSQTNPHQTPRAIPGLLALQGMAQARADTLHAQFEARWAATPAGQFLERVSEFALTLGKAEAGAGETKYPPLGIVRETAGSAAGV